MKEREDPFCPQGEDDGRLRPEKINAGKWKLFIGGGELRKRTHIITGRPTIQPGIVT